VEVIHRPWPFKQQSVSSPVSWDVMLCHWVISARCFKLQWQSRLHPSLFPDILTTEDEPMRQSHNIKHQSSTYTASEWRYQMPCCKSLKTLSPSTHWALQTQNRWSKSAIQWKQVPMSNYQTKLKNKYFLSLILCPWKKLSMYKQNVR